ncbi:MAG: FAD-binding oxidoreductase [Clostridia bacterium]|nr:FAD-binding oxidoreductase [Clostridia bacterium]
MRTGFDVAVVGAGVVGMSAAAELLRRGAGRVAVFERAAPGSGSTARAAGIVSRLTWDATDAELVARSQDAYREAAWTHPGRLRYEETGLLWLAAALGDVEPMRRRLARLAPSGIKVETLSTAEAAARWPDLEVHDAAALWFAPGDGRVYAPDYVALLAEDIRARGGEVRRDDPVARLEVAGGEGGRVTAVVSAEGRFPCGAVLVAAGAWTRKLLRASHAALDLPLKPYRTQLAVLDLDRPAEVPMLHDVTRGFYWIPEGGRLLFGDGTEERETDPDAFDERNDEPFLLSLAGSLAGRLRAGLEARYRSGWAGISDGTPDRRPLLGPHPAMRGLFVACGTNGFGVMRGPALGEAAAALVLGEEPAVDVRAFRPARFPGWFDFPVRQGFNTAD